MTSMSVKQPIDGLMLSNSLRAGVSGMARTLANEFGAHGITVNNVCPGYTLTERLESLLEGQARREGVSREEILSQMASRIPVGRIGKPEDVCCRGCFFRLPERAKLHKRRDDPAGRQVAYVRELAVADGHSALKNGLRRD